MNHIVGERSADFPFKSLEIVYLSDNDYTSTLFYIGYYIHAIELSGRDEYKLYPFIDDKALLIRRDRTAAYLFDIDDKSLSNIVPDRNNIRVLEISPRFIQIYDLDEKKYLLYDHMRTDPITEMKSSSGYEIKSTRVILPMQGNEILFYNLMDHTFHYRDKVILNDVGQLSEEHETYSWFPPFLIFISEDSKFVRIYKLDEDITESAPDDAPDSNSTLPLSMHYIDMIYVGRDINADFLGLTTGDDEAIRFYPKVINQGREFMLEDLNAYIIDGNNVGHDPSLTRIAETFVNSLPGRRVLVYKNRELREILSSYTGISKQLMSMISKYI